MRAVRSLNVDDAWWIYRQCVDSTIERSGTTTLRAFT